MANPTNEPIVNQPALYLNGFQISNDATTPNTILDIAAGQCRDSTNVYDINVGNFLNANPNLTANTATKINFGVNGVNGLDTGSIAASKIYYIYAIMDVANFKTPACIASLALPSVGPLMPANYGAYRWIGCCTTDASSHILLGYWPANNSQDRWFYYDAPQATAVTAGASNTYAAVTLDAFVPSINNIVVNIQSNFNANAAADTLKMQPLNGTGDAITVIAQVAGATAHIQSNSLVVAQLSATPHIQINYKVSAGNVAINVYGYQYLL